ncbi:hypothetical protein FN846DRAFT_783696 [Sphaerosporella brunnea]|uniref:Exonuclease domain-containing protein n=1 Tax=Sphaerosporella brunnea TaxID=1250544 RepID=A0A5J5EMV0_9PEZI|nr:hypothetical protein FN846DRAFT_783696 [Sphaerosporella brunnea]
MAVSPPPFRVPDEADEGEWELPGRNKKPKKEKVPKKKNYPEFAVSPQKLTRMVQLSDLQHLVLWLQADGAGPQWMLVRHKHEIRRVVVLMVPGLTLGMFDGSLDLNPDKSFVGVIRPGENEETEDYFPFELQKAKLPACVQDMAEMFPRAWPVKAAGDDRNNKMHSPIASFLTSPLPKKTDIVGFTPNAKKRLKVTQLLMTLGELVENEYPLHSSQLEQLRKELGQEETDEDRELLAKRTAEGWVETDLSKSNPDELANQAGSILVGKTIYSIDCEMVTTADGMELARISVIDWDGNVVYDQLVKPDKPITDYLTIYSGITAEMLAPISTTLNDVQAHLLALFNNDSILVGQSLNSDLAAMKFSHPHIIDTSVIYHHTRGPPYKASLKWLTQRFLKREIQKTSIAGHNSIEDARACLDLLKLKLDKGKSFGTSDENRESIFKRLSRPPHGPRRTAIADYGDPQKLYGNHATSTFACTTDDEVVAAVRKCSAGDPSGIPQMDFTWARLRALETARGFNQASSNGPIDIDSPLPELARDPPKEELVAAIQATVERIREVYEGLPKCTAFVVYSGTGDLRKWRQMNELYRRYKEEFKVRKWDEMGVKWTDNEDRGLRKALEAARRGVGFMVVK